MRAVEPDHRHVVADRHHVVGPRPVAEDLAAPVVHLGHAAVELDRVDDLRARVFPGIDVLQPVFRMLDLLAVLDLLAEHAVFVADAVTEAGVVERRHRFQHAGREPAQSAIAERGLGLDVPQLVEIDAEIGERLAARFEQAERDQAGLQHASGQQLERKIVDPLGVVGEIAPPCLHARGAEPPAQEIGQRIEPVLLGREAGIAPHLLDHVARELALDLLRRQGGREGLGIFCQRIGVHRTRAEVNLNPRRPRQPRARLLILSQYLRQRLIFQIGSWSRAVHRSSAASISHRGS